MRRTKILATLGPASNSEEMIHRLLTSGVDAFRLNFSHGRHEEHARVIAIIRDVAMELGRLLDQVQIERLSFDGLAALVPDEFAAHWQITLKIGFTLEDTP